MTLAMCSEYPVIYNKVHYKIFHDSLVIWIKQRLLHFTLSFKIMGNIQKRAYFIFS